MSSLRVALARSRLTHQEEQQQQQQIPNGTRVLVSFLEGAAHRDVEGTVNRFDKKTNKYFISYDDGHNDSLEEDIVKTYAENYAKKEALNPNLMDAIDEDRPQSRLSSAASRISSAVSRAGTALSRATTAVIRAATPFRDVFVHCKRRRGITTTVVIKSELPSPHVIGISPHIPAYNMPRVFLQGTYHDGEMKGSWADTMGCDGECTCKWVWKLADYDGKYICEGKFELDDDGNKTEIMEWVLEFTLEKNTEGNYNLSGNGSNQFGEYSLFGVICQDRVTVERVYFPVSSPDEEEEEEEEEVECWRHDHTVLGEGVKVLVRWNVNERYTGTVLAYDAETGKHLIRYDEDGVVELVDLAVDGYDLLDENDNPIESEEDESLGGQDVSDSDYYLESAEFDAPPKQKQTTQKKKQSPTQKQKHSPTQKQSPTQEQKQTTQKEGTATRLFIKPRNRKVGGFDDTVIHQNATITRCNSKLHEGIDKCICDTCKTNAADYNNSVTLQGTTDGEDTSVKFYIQIEPSIREALDFDPKFREKYNKVVAFREEEKGVMLKFGVIWINCYKGQTVIRTKYKDAAEKIPITVNGTTFEHMLHVDYKECRKNAWREYSLARKELLERLVTEGCKAGREKTELFKLIAEFDMKVSNMGKDFNAEERHFQSTYTDEMVADYIKLTKKEYKSLTSKEKTQKNRLSNDIQYSIAFDTLVVLMKAAVNAETKAGQILLRYWKHEIIQKYFRQLPGHSGNIKTRWERLLYSHKMTVEWVKEVLQLKFVQPTELDAIVYEDAGEL